MIRAYRIDGYKTKREGQAVPMEVTSHNDFYRHPELEIEIKKLLLQQSLLEKDIVSITASPATDRDPGSWYFWVFVNKPGE